MHNKTNYRFIGIYIGLSVLSALAATATYSVYNYLAAPIKEKCQQESQEHFDELVTLIEGEMSDIVKPAQYYADSIILNGLDLHDETAIYATLDRFVLDNSNISGAIIGFEDCMYPEYANKGGYGPLVRQQDASLIHIQVGEMRDFRNTTDWYLNVDEKTGPRWSEPFLSDDTTKSIISTYSIPLFDDEHQMIGKFGIDMNLKRLNEIANSFSPYPTSTVVIVNKDLTFLVHPNQEYVMNKTLTYAMQRIGIDPNRHSMRHAIERKKGCDTDNMGNKKMYFFYAPIEKTDWMILLYCPFDEILQELHTLQQKVLIFGSITALTIIIILIITIIHHIKSNKMQNQTM